MLKNKWVKFWWEKPEPIMAQIDENLSFTSRPYFLKMMENRGNCHAKKMPVLIPMMAYTIDCGLRLNKVTLFKVKFKIGGTARRNAPVKRAGLANDSQ